MLSLRTNYCLIALHISCSLSMPSNQKQLFSVGESEEHSLHKMSKIDQNQQWKNPVNNVL